jgi:antibiotic biosynthesis monooxygenase (ABM) superfamily enzyme
MIRMVTAVEVAPGHEAAWEEAWRTLRDARSRYPGFRGASLLRDSTRPTQYLVLSEWAEHAQLAEAMRGLGWLDRDQMAPWAVEPTRVYDEIVESVGDTPETGGGQVT